MKTENKEVIAEIREFMNSFVPEYPHLIYGAVLYRNQKLYVSSFNRPEHIYEVHNMDEYVKESKVEFIPESKHTYDISHNFIYMQDALRKPGEYKPFGSPEERVDCLKIIPGSTERFCADFPYAPFTEFTCSETMRWSYHGEASGYKLCNFMGVFSQYPYIELLMKNPLTEKIAYKWIEDPDNDLYRLNFKKGKNIHEITGMPDWMWKAIAEEDAFSINEWDIFRKWNKQLLCESKKEADEKRKNGIPVKEKDIYGLDQTALKLLLRFRCYSTEMLKKIRQIINLTVDKDGNRLFTVQSLFEYFEKVDTYQAIEINEAVELFYDYSKMCRDMKTVPVTDSNSLKREHDVCVRNYNLWLRENDNRLKEKYGNRFEKRSEYLEKFSHYRDEKLGLEVHVPKEIRDLIMEGYNNGNCVGSYVEWFSKGYKNIFFIRHISSPEKSYITIELDYGCMRCVQAALRNNMPVTSPSDLKFINDWLEHNRTIDA